LPDAIWIGFPFAAVSFDPSTTTWLQGFLADVSVLEAWLGLGMDASIAGSATTGATGPTSLP
tara:strand:+ start:417 stop:602 length:186 start_codon:yes stop_codon:yes gene_type:complete